MTTSIPTLKDVADEAEFKLICAKENLSWLAAIARAMARDVEVGGCRDTGALVGLVNFLDDTGFGSIDEAIDQFKEIAATQNAKSQNVPHASMEVPT
ncbi:hypothetical protein [Pseudomonas fluorescens]|uniref:Uncharacterized protein n=1 Tax=Pseudomonas fluorescens TaxID=294 RepID=A0A5E7ECJ6_PSEFL|nr:hypothetical protein [Pseudomonas fluorescens]VVO24369.1 hypothetical protein PS710_04502 [Pseudomonas fluorescens]